MSARRRGRPVKPAKQTTQSQPVANITVTRSAQITTNVVSKEPAGKSAPQKTEERKVVTLKTADGFVVTDENYASIAEGVMEKNQGDKPFGGLTTTKLRGIYSLIMNIYTKVNTSGDFERQKSDIQYLKVRMAYEAGREGSVRSFLNATHLMDLVGAITDFDTFKLYCRYAEALVAYFKFFGGKDS